MHIFASSSALLLLLLLATTARAAPGGGGGGRSECLPVTPDLSTYQCSPRPTRNNGTEISGTDSDDRCADWATSRKITKEVRRKG
jgi:hypothetical protein